MRPPAADEDLELVAARYIAANKTSNEVIRCARQWIERVRVMYGAERDQEIQNGPALACQRALDQRRGKPKPASARKA